MQMDLKDQDSLFSETLNIVSPQKRRLDIPVQLLTHRNSDAMILELETAAKEKRLAHLPDLDEKNQKIAEKAVLALTKIIDGESNHIWAWRMRNISGSHEDSGKQSR